MTTFRPSKYSVGSSIFSYKDYDTDVLNSGPDHYLKFDSLPIVNGLGSDLMVLSDGPKAYWPFRRLDAGGSFGVLIDDANSYDLAAVQSPSFSFILRDFPNGDNSMATALANAGRATNDNALDFNFTDGTEWTVEFWLKFTSTKSAVEVVLGSFPDGLAQPWNWRLIFDAAERIVFEIGNTANAAYLSVQTNSLATNTWYHFVAIKESGDVLRGYLNNVALTADTTPTGTAQTPTGSYKLFLGSNGADLLPLRTATRLAKCAIYNRSLTLAEIAEHYAERNTLANGYLEDSVGTLDLNVTRYQDWVLYPNELPDGGNALLPENYTINRNAWFTSQSLSLPNGSGSEARTLELIFCRMSGIGNSDVIQVRESTSFLHWVVNYTGNLRATWRTTSGTEYLRADAGSALGGGSDRYQTHYAFVFHCGATRKIDAYRDGILTGTSGAPTGTPTYTNVSNTIEFRPNSTPAEVIQRTPFARIAWYGRALSDFEIASHFESLNGQ